MSRLPSARTPGVYRVAVVCLGNICRSPIADVVLNDRLAEPSLDPVTVESFGTGSWHVGRGMDPRSAAVLSEAGYDATRHRAQQFTAALADDFDLVLAMDRANRRDLLQLGVPEDRLLLFRDFDPTPGDGEVPDPYTDDDGFPDVLATVERTSDRLIAALGARLTATEPTAATTQEAR